MRTKKFSIILILSVLFVVIIQFPLSAEDISFEAQYDKLLHSSGADKLYDIVPEDAKSILEDTDISELSQDSLINISFFDFVGAIFKTAKDAVTQPLTMLLSCIGIILLCALLNSMKSSFNNSSYEQVFSTISVICISSVIIMPIAQLIIRISKLITVVSDFLLSFVPVYVGIVSVSGKPISAIAYQASLIGVIQVVSRICSTVLVPLLGIYMAFCLIGSASREINIESIARSVKTIVIVTLSFLMTIFVGLLVIQGNVANSADSVALRTAKFAISAFLPVVGGAISEALNSVGGCVSVIRSTVGGFGIIAVAAAFLPSIITVLLMQLSLSIAGAVSDAMGTNKITALLHSAGSVLALIMGIMVIFCVLIVISLGIMLTISSTG